MPTNEVERRYAARRRLWSDAFAGINLAGKSVLDAGTGQGYFTRFLAEQTPARLVSITCLEEEIAPARQQVGDLSDRVEFMVADLTSMPALADAMFDVVAGDFLIAAVAAYSPYREIECLKELIRVLRPGGRLILTGWEISSPARTQTEQDLRRLLRLREILHLLAASPPFREHPRFWIENRLADLGMPPERSCTVPDVHHDVHWLLDSVSKLLDDLPRDALYAVLRERLQDLATALANNPTFQNGVEFGRLYAVIACKLQGAILLSQDHS